MPDPRGLLAQNGMPPGAYRAPPANSTHFPSYSFPEWLFTTTPGLYGTVHGLANPTGVALMAILAVIIVSSMKWVRKGGYFEASCSLGVVLGHGLVVKLAYRLAALGCYQFANLGH